MVRLVEIMCLAPERECREGRQAAIPVAMPPMFEFSERLFHTVCLRRTSTRVEILLTRFGQASGDLICGEVNDPVGWLLGEALPSTDPSRDKLAGGEQRPKQHGGGFG